MNKSSIKLKITLWFTIFMILLVAAVFAFMFLFSNVETSHELRDSLIALVEANLREVDEDDGEIEIEDEFVTHRNGIYSLVFHQNGSKIRGSAPEGFPENAPFEDGVVRTLSVGGESYLVYDRFLSFSQRAGVVVRGIVAESVGAISSSAVSRAAWIALPLLLLLAAGGGYIVASRSLRPIQQIARTAEEIRVSGDLTKRIPVTSDSGSGSEGDELNRLARTFNNMLDRLHVNFEAEKSFASDASHELRTPVTTILAQCEYAFENASDEKELYESIGAIQKQGYRMSHLIESLLAFTRIEQRTEAPTLQRIDISAPLAVLCREKAALADKNIRLVDNISPTLFIDADINLFMRIPENLIANAFKYGRENGEIHVTLQGTDHEVILSVADNGIGIDPRELPFIWNRFYRADKARTGGKGAGLGLGLAMVKQITELHGGRVDVRSTPGMGSIFYAIFSRKISS